MLTSRKSFPSSGLQMLFSRRVRHTRADKGVYSPRLGHLQKIRTTSLLRHFKKVHLNFHQFFFQNLSSVETYHLFKRKKLVKNQEYRIKYFKVHVLYDKQTIQNFVLRIIYWSLRACALCFLVLVLWLFLIGYFTLANYKQAPQEHDTLWWSVIECFHSRGQHLCKSIGTKESVCIRKEFNSHGAGLGHQHGRSVIVGTPIWPP